jgi:hypothetical protein
VSFKKYLFHAMGKTNCLKIIFRGEGEKMNVEMINEGKLVTRILGRVTRAPTLF